MRYCAIFASHAWSAIMFKTLLACFSQVMNGVVVLLVALAGYDSCLLRALVLGFAYPSKCFMLLTALMDCDMSLDMSYQHYPQRYQQRY